MVEIENISESTLNSLSVWAIVVNETLLVQTQSCIVRNFPKLEIKFIFNSKP